MFKQINDLSQSPLRLKFAEQEFKPATNLTVAMGRVSSKKQKGDAHHSDQAQLDTISRYIEREGLVLAHDPWDVAETASKHEKRRNFIDMMNFVAQSQSTLQPIKHVVFSHQSRSNRNRESARELEALVRSSGVTLHCVRDGLRLTSMSPLEDWIKWDLFNNLNEKYIKDHRRNVWDGMTKRIERGLFPGKGPFGYRNYRASEDALSVFVLADGPDRYMKKAFELIATDYFSLAQVHCQLESNFSWIEKRPSAKRLGKLLRNPFYYGDFIFDGQLFRGNPEAHPPLISFDLWQRAQDVLDGKNRRRVTQGSRPYIGMMRCGGRLLDSAGKETETLCGCAVTAEEKRKSLVDGSERTFHYYHCSRNKSDGHCSQRDTGFMKEIGRHVNYTEVEIEALFEAVFRPISFTPEVCAWMQDVLRKEHAEKSGTHRTQLSALQDRHKMLERYIDKAYEDKLLGTISEVHWRSQHAKWTKESDQIQSQIESFCTEKYDYIEKGVLLIELAQHTERIYKNATPDVKRKLVQIVSSNHVLRNGTIQFDYRKPFDVLAKSTPKENWWTRGGSNS